MNKKEYLILLDSRLRKLERKERYEIVSMYDEQITEKINQGTDEKLAVKELGDINIMVEGIYTEYNIKDHDAQRSIVFLILFALFATIPLVVTFLTFGGLGFSFMYTTPIMTIGGIAAPLIEILQYGAIQEGLILRSLVTLLMMPLISIGWLWLSIAFMYLSKCSLDALSMVFTKEKYDVFSRFITLGKKWGSNKKIIKIFLILFAGAVVVMMVWLPIAISNDYPIWPT